MSVRKNAPGMWLAAGAALLLAGCGAPSSPSTPAATSDSAAASSAVPTHAATTPQATAANAALARAPANPDAGGNTAADVDKAIEMVAGGDPQAFHDVFEHLQKAMAASDKPGVAALVSYPLKAHVGGKALQLANAQELIAHWDDIVTPAVRKAVADQKYSAAFVNAQGLMLGDGEVWISAVCKDAACTDPNVLVTAIQPGPK